MNMPGGVMGFWAGAKGALNTTASVMAPKNMVRFDCINSLCGSLAAANNKKSAKSLVKNAKTTQQTGNPRVG
jgi:hypothetical protein